MVRYLALMLLAAAPCSAAVIPIKVNIPGTGASVSGYAAASRNCTGLKAAFTTLTGPIVAGFGSNYRGESWMLENMLVKSVQKIAPRISSKGVALVKIGPAVIVMPRSARDRTPRAKIAVVRAGDSTTYRLTTMRDLSSTYEKAIAAGAIDSFDIMFDKGSDRRLPGMPTPRIGSIP